MSDTSSGEDDLSQNPEEPAPATESTDDVHESQGTGSPNPTIAGNEAVQRPLRVDPQLMGYGGGGGDGGEEEEE